MGEEITGVNINGRLAPGHRRGLPGSTQKLPVGVLQGLRPGGNFLGRELDDGAVCGEKITGRNEAWNQQRLQGFHALDRDTLGDLFQHHLKALVFTLELPGPGAHLIGEQHFSNRWNHHVSDWFIEGALVGNGKILQGLNLGAKEIKANRMFGKWWEHIHNSTAHRVFAAPGHQVHSDISALGEVVHPRLETHGRGPGSGTLGRNVHDVGVHRLDQCPNRGDHEQWPRVATLCGAV